MDEKSETPAPTFVDGDTLTIKRGKFGGQTGRVLALNLDGRYVVKLDDGNVTLVEKHNVKTPAERTITEGELVKAIQSASDESGDMFPRDIYAELERILPGIRDKVVGAVVFEDPRGVA